MQRSVTPTSQRSTPLSGSRSGPRATSRQRQSPRLWDISQRLHPGLPVWPGDVAFAARQSAGIHHTTIEALAERGIVSIGTDAPSVDPQTSKELLAQHAISRHGLAILEGPLLARAAAGDYELLALPRNIQNVEAAPVRAILRELAE